MGVANQDPGQALDSRSVTHAHGPHSAFGPPSSGAAVAIAISRGCRRESSVSSGWKAQSRSGPAGDHPGGRPRWPVPRPRGRVRRSTGRADEHGAHRVGPQAANLELDLEARDLAAEGVAPRRRVHKARCSRSQTIIPAQVPRMGSPESACARIAGSSPSRSIAFAIVVLSPPGMTSPSRSRSSSADRTSTGSRPASAASRHGGEIALAGQHSNPEPVRPAAVGRRSLAVSHA